jgi:hypothetical protein
MGCCWRLALQIFAISRRSTPRWMGNLCCSKVVGIKSLSRARSTKSAVSRMVKASAQLVDHAIPEAPVRPWLLSFPPLCQ